MMNSNFCLRTPILFLALFGILFSSSAALAVDCENSEELSGVITDVNLGIGQFTVAGLTLGIDEETEIEDAEGQPVTFADLAVGLAVDVEYCPDEAIAQTIVITQQEGQEAELEGRIKAIDDILREMTISDKIVKTTAGTSFLDDEGQAITFEDFVVNDYVEVDGVLNQDGSISASVIEKEEGLPECEGEIEDRITGVNAEDQTVRIGHVLVLVNSSTVIELEDGSTGAFDDLEIGLSVELKYCPDLGAPPIARKIIIEDEPVDTEIELEGPITDIELLASSMTVNGTIIIVTGNPTLLDEQEQVITFEDFELQDYVEVEGSLQPDETVLADRVKIEDKDRDDCEEKIRAFVNEIDAANNRLVTGLITVRVDADTEIKDDESGLAITLADLVVGDSVKIEYCPGANEPLAFEIERKAAGDFDLDDDNEVGQSDVLQIQRKWRQGGIELDLDGDNRTTGRDVILFSNSWKQ